MAFMGITTEVVRGVARDVVRDVTGYQLNYAPEGVQFHGDNSYLSINSSGVFPSSTELTISFFVRWRNTGSNQPVVQISGTSGTPTRLQITLLPTRVVRLFMTGSGGTPIMSNVDVFTVPDDGEYHLVQLAYDSAGNVIKAALDGAVSSYVPTNQVAVDVRDRITIGAQLAASLPTLSLGSDIKGLWLKRDYIELSTLTDGRPPADCLFDFSGNATEWNYGQHSGTLGDFTMIGYGVDYPYDVNKIAFRNQIVIDDASTGWAAVDTGSGLPDGNGSVAGDMPVLFADAIGLANTDAGQWEGWEKTTVAYGDDCSDGQPINFHFHNNYNTTTRDIRISISHDGVNYTRYSFGGEATCVGDLTLTCLPSMALTPVTVNTGVLPVGCFIDTAAWDVSQGISDIIIEFYGFHAYWNSNDDASELHAAYLGCTRGIPFTPTFINTEDDGRDALVDAAVVNTAGDAGTGMTTIEYIEAINAAGTHFPFHIGVIGAGHPVGLALTAAEMAAIYSGGTTDGITYTGGSVHFTCHGDYPLDSLVEVEIDYSSGVAFTATDMRAAVSDVTGHSGVLLRFTEGAGSTQTLVIYLDNKGNTFTNTGEVISGVAGSGTYAVAGAWASQSAIEAELSANRDTIVSYGYPLSMASHYVYPLGGYRFHSTAVPAYRNIAGAFSSLGFKTARTTAQWTSGGIGKAGVAKENGVAAWTINSYNVEDTVTHMPANTDYDTKFIPYFLETGGFTVTRFHKPVPTVGGAYPTGLSAYEMDIDVLCSGVWDKQVDQIAAGRAKCLTMDELYTQLAAHMSWTETAGIDYDP